jgi:hypothetical protein
MDKAGKLCSSSSLVERLKEFSLEAQINLGGILGLQISEAASTALTSQFA